MTSYIQIADDPTKWWPGQPFNASQLTGQPVSVKITSPVAGFLVISPRAAGVAVFESNQATPAGLTVTASAIYVPTAAGLSAGHTGYELPASVNVENLAGQLVTLMRNSGSQTITLGGSASGGSLVLNGATLSFAVLFTGTVGGTQAPPPVPESGMEAPPAVGGAVPHGAETTGAVPHGVKPA